MYGTIAKLRVLPGHYAALKDLQAEWDRDRRPVTPGAGAAYYFSPDHAEEGVRYIVAIFDDRDAYRANADDPAQDEWYRRMRSHLAADPEWMDGTFDPT